MDGRRSTALNLISSILLLTIFAIGLVDSVTPGSPKSSGSSVFSLFNLGEKSKFWSESVIHGVDFDDLESSSPGKMGAVNYTKAGNIANYLKLMEVDSVYLPVPVNFIFIGFEGKGNQEFKLHPDELEHWFTKIDHIFEHTRVPHSGDLLNPFYKTSTGKEQRHLLPIVSHINYNFSVHAIQMGEKVSSVFEHAINAFTRKDVISSDRDDGNTLWQVDVDMMDTLFTSLVDYLELENAYNIFVLNPKRDGKRAKYGYRRGLSESEILFLKENNSLQTKILQSGSIPESVLALEKIKRPLYKNHPMLKFSWTITEDTDTLLKGKDEDTKLLLQKDSKSGDFSDLRAECLTDAWIGKDRWAFIDLTAGPFSWGPTVGGGEGVRTELSFPNVEKTVGAVQEISEDEAEDRLQDAIQEKFSVFGDKDHQAIDILLAEMDIYELFAFKHCKGRKVKLPLCEELDGRMRDLKNELQSFEGEENDENLKKKAMGALKRMENWNLFSDTNEEFQNYTVARDNFLAQLGATLWGSTRHIISPSIADGAFHHYEKILFQLFFVTQEKVRHIKQLPVDLKALMDGLSSLLLPVKIMSYMLPLSEDPALAMAFSVARRAAVIPLLLVNGTYRKTIRAYLDSSILQYQLQRLNGHASLKGAHAHGSSTLEVPIFWFIHRDPLLVDKNFQAKALSDMVIVVQSDQSFLESPLQCNGKSLLLDLRKPIKAAMAAVSEHLAGLLPLPLVYSQAHESAIEDWTWSIGCNPFSMTSQGWHISQFQSDTIARSYIITALEESIQSVNSAIHLLFVERTTEKTYKLFASQERELVKKYNYVVSLWKRISTFSGELQYVDAIRFLHTMEAATKEFAEKVNSTITILHPIHCTKERKVQFEFDLSTVPAFIVVLGVLYLVLKPRRPKPKIN